MTSERDRPLAVPYLPSLGRLLGFAAKATSELSEKRLAAYDLTLPQWILMTALWRRDALTVGQLAAYARASEPTTSALIGRMESKGLLERRLDRADRRQVRVHVTEKGQALSHLMTFYEQINETLMQGFSASERKAFASMMERVIQNAGSD